MIRRTFAAAVLLLVIAPLLGRAQTGPPAPQERTPSAASTPAASTAASQRAKRETAAGANRQNAAASAKPQPKKESPADWFHRVFGIDVRAYANLTAVRGEREVEPAPRLVSFDRRTGKEETLWECGGCWSPFPIGSDLYVLRQTTPDAADAALWVVHRDGTSERVISVPAAIAIVGVDGGRLIAGVPAGRCADSAEGPNAFVAIDVENARLHELDDSPCVGSLGLTSSARVRGDRYLDTTHRADLHGNRRDRVIQVLSPATGETPTAVPFDSRLAGAVDRYDPVWLSEDRIVYVANP